MFEISNKLYLINKDVYYSLRVFFWTSLGMYFFILFFQPFVLNYKELNDQLLYISGFSMIVFISLFLFFVVLPWVFPALLTPRHHETRLFMFINTLAWLFCSTGFTFYIRYVGGIDMSMFIVFKTGLLCLVPIVILAIIRENESLKQQLRTLRENHVRLNMMIQAQSADSAETIQFVSDSRSDDVELSRDDVLYIKSADNYVEIIYTQDNVHKNKLIRTTMKNMEEQLRNYTDFVRCHRTCIVNTRYIVRLNRSYSGYSLKLHGYDQEIPVSRQYLLSVRDVLGIT